MICKDCKGQKCEACKGVGEVNTAPPDDTDEDLQKCDACSSTGRVAVHHETCKDRNADKQPADCDCAHRE